MSVQATTWVWEHSRAKGTARLVALAIADAANREGERSCQSVATIARMTGVSERTVQRALRELEQLGELEATGTDAQYGTTVYRMPGVGGDRLTPPGVTPVTPGGDTHVTGGVTPVTPGGDTHVTQPHSYPKDQPQEDPTERDERAQQQALIHVAPSSTSPQAVEKPVDRREQVVRELVTQWWEQQEPRPAGRSAWHSALASVRAVIKAGHSVGAIRQALDETPPPLSVGSLEFALNRVRRQQRSRETTDDRVMHGLELAAKYAQLDDVTHAGGAW